MSARDTGARIMTMHRLLQTLAFDQDGLERLSVAYEDALRALKISDRTGSRARLSYGAISGCAENST